MTSTDIVKAYNGKIIKLLQWAHSRNGAYDNEMIFKVSELLHSVDSSKEKPEQE